MPCCDTGRNIQKYKGAAASTLQDALENGNTASLNINLSSPAVFIGDGGGLSNISASAVAGNLQAVTDNGAATTNKITLTNGLTSLVTSGNVLVTGNVTASFFRGDGGTLSNIAANKNFQEVTDLGATSSNKITLTNSATSLQTSGNVVVTGNVTASKFYGDGTTLTGVALSTDLVSNSTRIGTVSTDLASNSSRISTVSTDLASNSTRIGTVSTDLASNSTRIGTVSTDLADNSTRISTVSTDLASNSTRIGTVSTDLASNSTRIGTVSTDLASNSTRIGTVSTDLASNSTRIGTVSTDLASNSTRIGTVSTDLASNSTRIGTVSTDLASNSTRIGTVSTDLASNSTRIGTVSTDLASNSTRIGTVSTDLASNSSRIGTVSTDLTSNASRINTLESEVQPVNRGGTGISSSYTVGQILVASDTAVFTPLTPGTSGHFLKSQGAGSALVWASVADVGSATPSALSADGFYLTGGPFNGSSPATFTVQGSNVNTSDKLVARDALGDIYVSNVSSSSNVNAITLKANVIANNIVTNDGRGINQLNASNVSIGKIAIARGGTGATTAAAAATALGLGTGNSPQFTGISLGTTVITESSGTVSIGSNEIRTGTVPVTKGGTGLDTVTGGDILYASANDTIAALNKGSNGEYLRLAGGIPDWHENIAAKITAVDSTSSSQLPVPFMSAATGDVTVNSDSGALQYQASSGTLSSTIFSGSGASLTNLPASELTGDIASARLPTVPVTKGGTGLDTVTAGDILYASANDTIAGLDKGDNGQFLTLSDGLPAWATVSVSSTTISTTNEESSANDHGLIFVANAGTGAQALLKDSSGSSFGTLKYKPSTGTLTTSNIITSDTSIYARNGIANTTPVHTLDIGSNVAVIDDGVDKLYIRGNVYSTHDIISLGTIHCKEIVAVNSRIKNSTVVTEAPTRQVRSI